MTLDVLGRASVCVFVYRTRQMLHVTEKKKNRFLFLEMLQALERACPVSRFERIYVVLDNYKIHTAKAVQAWLKQHPRFEMVWLPSHCPRANPVERAVGDVHDKCTLNYKRKRLRDLMSDVRRHLRVNGPWPYQISEIYYMAEVTRAVADLQNAAHLQAA